MSPFSSRDRSKLGQLSHRRSLLSWRRATLCFVTLAFVAHVLFTDSLPSQDGPPAEKEQVSSSIPVFRNKTVGIFFKFHKVGGATLAKTLRTIFPNDWPEGSPCLQEKGLEQPLTHGPIIRYSREGRAGLVRCSNGEDMVTIAILRDPFERTMSWIFSEVGGLGYSTWNDLPLKKEDLWNIANCVYDGGFFEYVSRLAYPNFEQLNRDIHAVGNLKPGNQTQWQHNIPDIQKTIYADKKARQTAVEAISNSRGDGAIDILLIKEYYCESFAVLAYQLDISYEKACPPALQHWWNGHAEDRTAVEPDVQIAIKDMLEIEYDIYDAAVRRFNSTLQLLLEVKRTTLSEVKLQISQACPKLECN